MQFTVKLFAHLKDRFGETVNVESEPTSGALLTALAEQGLPVETSRLAVNLRFVRGATELSAADELALIPPVSGG